MTTNAVNDTARTAVKHLSDGANGNASYTSLRSPEYFRANHQRLGISRADFERLAAGRYEDLLPVQVQLHGHSFHATSAYWLLHSLDEIFVREVYRFQPRRSAGLIIDCGA